MEKSAVCSLARNDKKMDSSSEIDVQCRCNYQKQMTITTTATATNSVVQNGSSNYSSNVACATLVRFFVGSLILLAAFLNRS